MNTIACTKWMIRENWILYLIFLQFLLLMNKNSILHIEKFLGIFHSITIYEKVVIGSDHFHILSNDHKPFLSCFTEKGNLSSASYPAQMKLTEFQKLRVTSTNGKNLSVADVLSHSFTQEEIQLNQRKHKHLSPQIHFAALTDDNQIRPVQYLVKNLVLLPSQKDDCHPILVVFGIDHFSNRNIDRGENIMFKPLDSVSMEALKAFLSDFKNFIWINTKIL